MPIVETNEEPEPAAKASAVERCASAIREAIVRGELPPGLRLPPERALAERFAVNRVTVRTALARLETEHLVAVRQGSGYVVRDYHRSGGPDLIATLASLAKTSSDRAAIVSDLLLVRRQLAQATLERLLDVADDASLAAATSAIDRFEALLATGPDLAAIARADLDVAAALVAATKSVVLELCFNPVAALLRDLPALQAAMYRDPSSNVAAYRMVVEVVRSRARQGLALAVTELAARDAATVAAFLGSRRKK